jgi:hypothetical protein
VTLVEHAQRKALIPTKDAWSATAARYRKLAEERADEGTSVQLACLVLADYCVHKWLGTHGGPTLEMVALAENTVGEQLDEIVAAVTPKTSKEIAP